MRNSLFNKVFNGKKILVTGHTGFKGAWLTLILHQMGAELYGYALEPPTKPSMFKEANIYKIIKSYFGDIRDFAKLKNAIKEIEPEIIFHMAAQSLVLPSYQDPVETYSVNVMGTVKLLEAIRHIGGVRAVVNVCLLYTSPSPRDRTRSRMPSSA